MTAQDLPRSDQFWTPEFHYEHREDGTVLMRQKEPLQAHPPLLADYLDKWADEAPERTWIARRADGGDWIRIAYGQARDKARAIGAALLAMGLGPDRPLLILSENSLEHALLGIACAYVGIPYAPVSPAYSLVSEGAGKARDIASLLNPGAIFADNGAMFATAIDLLSQGDRTVINARHLADGAVSFDSLLDSAPGAADTARAALTPDMVVKYLFTSGSTGSPKAVINTNSMICAMQAMVRDCYRFLTARPPVVLDWAPWNHTAAGNKVSYLVLTNGGTYYIDDGRPVPGQFDETLRNLREISCTWYFNVPIGYDMLVRELASDVELARIFYARLDMLFYAGAGMAQHTWDNLMEIGAEVTGRDFLLATALGATETAPFAIAWTELEKKAGNVGVPSRGLTLKLVPAEGKLEARLKGPSITPGYFGDPAKTAEVFDDEGFYCLGDALRPADPEDFSRGFFFDGRVAENFKLSTGTWVSVGAVRAGLVDAMGGLIRDAVIVGENESRLGAMLWLSEVSHQMAPADLNQALAERLSAAAKAATGSASRVRRAVLLPHEPSFDRGETTEKGNLNQRALRVHNAGTIGQMYATDDGVFIV
ncbi:MAG: feruloyl-CoA synthase [Rhodobacteraceae bacterium]|nr:feruloyl-CoA synthase [Paracoccaceae bacterium]